MLGLRLELRLRLRVLLFLLLLHDSGPSSSGGSMAASMRRRIGDRGVSSI